MHLLIIFSVVLAVDNLFVRSGCCEGVGDSIQRRYVAPQNYLQQIHLPYIGDVPIPYNVEKKIQPTTTTKVLKVVTSYLYRNPVCIKISGTKPPCGGEKSELSKLETSHKTPAVTLYLQGSEPDSGTSSGENLVRSSVLHHTPALTSNEKIREMLIEDRLDQLETILPSYTRRRVYETSTITVTRVKDNSHVTATLSVKNCVPEGYQICPPKVNRNKGRIAKIAKGWSLRTDES